MYPLQPRDPVGGVALEMHEAFRTGDLCHRDGGVEGVAAGDPVRHFELMGAEADAVAAVGKLRIKPGGRRLDAAGIGDLTVFLLDADDVCLLYTSRCV